MAQSRHQRQSDTVGGVLRGGVSGMVFDAGVQVTMRLSHDGMPLGPRYRVSKAKGHVAQRYVHDQTGLLLLFASDVADFPPPPTAWQG